jgi:hypothetical protein
MVNGTFQDVNNLILYQEVADLLKIVLYLNIRKLRRISKNGNLIKTSKKVVMDKRYQTFQL